MPGAPARTLSPEAAAVSAVLLAAGTSRRFGGQKLLAPLGGVPLVCRAARYVRESGVAEVVVVLGHGADAVRAALECDAGGSGAPLRFVLNRRYASGLSSSLRAGLRAAAPEAGAVVVALGDQPRVPTAVIDGLITVWRGGAGPIVAPSYRGFRGNPVLFDRSVFPELLRLRGDAGARSIVASHPDRVTLVAVDLPAPRDVDTPADRVGLEA